MSSSTDHAVRRVHTVLKHDLAPGHELGVELLDQDPGAVVDHQVTLRMVDVDPVVRQVGQVVDVARAGKTLRVANERIDADERRQRHAVGTLEYIAPGAVVGNCGQEKINGRFLVECEVCQRKDP